MFLSGAGSPWSLMTLLLLALSLILPLLVCVFFMMLSFHSPPTHCCSLKLSRGWTPHCFCPCAAFQKCMGCREASHSVCPLLFPKEGRSCLGQLHFMLLYISLWQCPNSVSLMRFITRDCSQSINCSCCACFSSLFSVKWGHNHV